MSAVGNPSYTPKFCRNPEKILVRERFPQTFPLQTHFEKCASVPAPKVQKWRKRVGVEPTGDRKTCRPPVLKTGTITGPHALPRESDEITSVEIFFSTCTLNYYERGCPTLAFFARVGTTNPPRVEERQRKPAVPLITEPAQPSPHRPRQAEPPDDRAPPAEACRRSPPAG